MNIKETPGNNSLTKLITNTIGLPMNTITKLFNKKPLTQKNRNISFETKQKLLISNLSKSLTAQTKSTNT